MQSILTWQQALSNAISDPQELLEILDLDLGLLPLAKQAVKLFPLKVPRDFIHKIKKGDLADPLLRQILPLDQELLDVAGYVADPLQEKNSNPLPGLLHKYQGRVLLTVTGACGINCRFCFRREFPYENNNPGSTGWEAVLAYIAADSSIEEVIFSGGDPLVANDHQLAKLSQKLAAISHVKTLRIHTRMPIVLPQRITEEFIAWFTGIRLKPVLVLHCNHPQELDSELGAALQKLQTAGVMLLNQAVLLKEINDDANTLIRLNKKLFAMGVLPYYLHLLDPVRGTAHFAVSEIKALEIMEQLTGQLPGYLVPKLVREKAGALAKVGVG